MADPATLAAAATIVSAISTFVLGVMKHEESKQDRKTQEEASEAQRRQDQRRNMEFQAAMKKQQEEQERANKEAQRRQDEWHQKWQAKRDEEFKATLKMKQEEKEKDRRDRAEAEKELKRERRAQVEREWEARREQEKMHAKLQEQREAEWEAAMKKQQEGLERERRDRVEAERRRDKEADHLRKYVEKCMMIFLQLMLRQQNQQRHCRCHESEAQNKGHWAKTFDCSSEPKRYEEDLGPYIVELLPHDFEDDKELLGVFNASLLQDVGAHSSNAAVSFELLEYLKQPPQDFKDNIYSLVLAKINVSSSEVSDEAKEEGNAYYKDQKFDEAVKCYTKSIHKIPTAVAYANRAMAYLKINRLIEAEEDCTEALKIDGYYFKAYARRAQARRELGHLKEALEDVKSALHLEPLNQEMMNLRFELVSLHSKALAEERAYDQKENATQAKEKGDAYFKNRKFDEAIKCYSESIDISPNAEAYAKRAEAYLKLNRFADAEEDCTEALKLDDKGFKVYAARATARASLTRNLDGALKDVESALELEPAQLEMKELRAKLMNLIDD